MCEGGRLGICPEPAQVDFAFVCELIGSLITFNSRVPLNPVKANLSRKSFKQLLGVIDQRFVSSGFPLAREHVDGPLAVGVHCDDRPIFRNGVNDGL